MTSLASKEFWKCLRGLPAEVQDKAHKSFELWRKTPTHPSLHFRRVSPHAAFSVRIGLHYRAICVELEPEVYMWEWIGSHADYDKIVRTID